MKINKILIIGITVVSALLLSGGTHSAEDHCSICDKDGKIKVRVKCKKCDGGGWVMVFKWIPASCGTCRELGYLYKNITCPICYGTKNKNIQKSFNVYSRIFYE